MKLLPILLLFISLFLTTISAQGVLRDKEAYLQELAVRYEESTREGSMEAELAALDPYIAEATRQGNKKEECYARMNKVYCYYNYDNYEQLDDEIDRQMDYFSRKNYWEEYYLCSNLRIEALIYQSKPVSALREAERQYNEALLLKDSQAIALTAYGLFCCYHCSGRNDEAARIYKEVEKNEKYIPFNQRPDYYVMYGSVLYSLKQYDELLQHAIRFEAFIDHCDEEVRRKGVAMDNTMHRFYVYYSFAEAYEGLGQYDKAETYFRKASGISRHTPSNRIPLFELNARILSGQGRYTEALAQIDSALNDPDENESHTIQLTHRSMKADILHDARRFEEASDLYRQVIDLTDSVSVHDMEIQLNDLRTLYKLDQYKMETSLRNQQLLFALIACALLALVLLVIVRSYRLVRRKNRALCEQIEQQAMRFKQEVEARKEAQTTLPLAPQDTAANENELFTRLNLLLTEEKLYLTPEINRDMLVDRLGTNKNKLAEAITAGTGRSLTEYITELRLREALLLMEAQPDLPLAQIAEQAGFGVYSSFYRAFNKQYGVKPTEYRNYRKQE